MLKKLSLFVYGSFVQGRVHHQKLSQFFKGSEPAHAQGSAYRLPVGYPVLCDQGDDWVAGEVVYLEGPEILFRLLDEFHGVHPLVKEKSLFFRQNVKVRRRESGVEAIEAYVINPDRLPPKSIKIPSGDWQVDLQSNPPMVQQITPSQREYIRRLGSSTGREIVPIDLGLYRELMKLELIVDKGRRLALTKLGKEVYKYLDWKWEEALRPS